MSYRCRDNEKSKTKTPAKDSSQNEQPPSKKSRKSGPETQPPLLTFKAFLNTQDDNITDEEAAAKYTQYKLEFHRTQIKDFFINHKEDDWFKLKYHPKISVKRKEEIKAGIHRRAHVFMDMLNSSYLDEISLESDKGEAVERLLDIFVIRLECYKKNLEGKSTDEGNSADKLDIFEEERNTENEKCDKELKGDYEWIIIDDVGGDDEEEDDIKKHEKVNEALQFSKTDNSEVKVFNFPCILPDNTEKELNMRSNDNEFQSILPDDSVKESYKDEVKSSGGNILPLEELKSDKSKEEDEESLLKSCTLHKTRSIFLRNISSLVSKEDIEEACKNYPGFLRVWLSDAQADQQWTRRGFVTFKRDVNIKQICWSLNSVKIKGCEWQAVVNHDLAKRIRSANPLAKNKQVVMADMHLATKIIKELDCRAGLWAETEGENPLFMGITDYLVEEAPAEAEELLGESAVIEEYNAQNIDKLKILDKLLMYLRMVHSVDYYNGSHYTFEDEMPNRCGIIHLRVPQCPTEVKPSEIEDYIENHNEKLKSLFSPLPTLPEPLLPLLGYKDIEEEIEKFIKSNTQELASDKFLCPLSGKKFKAPEFVKKHIQNKFPHELDIIRFEVEYLNNYIIDPKRPELPPHPGLPARREVEQHYPYPYPGPFRRGFPFNHFGGHPGFMRGRGHAGRGRGFEGRPVVTYKDLDAPNEPEEMV